MTLGKLCRIYCLHIRDYSWLVNIRTVLDWQIEDKQISRLKWPWTVEFLRVQHWGLYLFPISILSLVNPHRENTLSQSLLCWWPSYQYYLLFKVKYLYEEIVKLLSETCISGFSETCWRTIICIRKKIIF